MINLEAPPAKGMNGVRAPAESQRTGIGEPPPGFFDDTPAPPPGLEGDEVQPPTATEPAASAPSIVLLDGPAIAAPLPDLEYLVREIGLVAGGGAPHLVAGYGFSGKTLALQGLALALAGVRPAWGSYHVRDARRVVHVDLEQGERLTRRRYQRLARAMDLDLASLGDALALAVMPPGLTLTPEREASWLQLMTGRDLMILDSLKAATGGQDENSSDIRAGLDMLGHLSEQTGCRGLVIHHARKMGPDDPGGRYAIRGSSAIFDGTDSAYLFSAAKGEPISVEHIKARSHGELVEDFALVISDVEFDGAPRAGLRAQVHGAELVAQRRNAQDEKRRKDQAIRDADSVRKALSARHGLGTVELRAATGLSGSRVTTALVELGEAVDVRLETQGRSTTKRHYLRGTT